MPHPEPAPAKKPSFRERVDAMRNLPPFLRQVWQTSRWLTLASLGLRLVRALMPVAMLYVGKLIIDEAVRLAGINPKPYKILVFSLMGLLAGVAALFQISRLEAADPNAG